MNNVQEKSSKPKTKTKNKIPSINFYPENWKVRVNQVFQHYITTYIFLVDWADHIGHHPSHPDTGGHQPFQDGLYPRQHRHQAPQHREYT